MAVLIAHAVLTKLKQIWIAQIAPNARMEKQKQRLIVQIVHCVQMELKGILSVPIAVSALMAKPRLKLTNQIVQSVLLMVNSYQRLDV